MFSWLLWATLVVSFSLCQAQTFVKGQKWQIILYGTPDTSKMPLPPVDAPVWDIDLFDNDATAIATLKAAGKIVICYFSAGTAEDWRPDYNQFPASDMGKILPDWPNEKWVRITSQKIRDIMATRIKMASDKGCDAIDPDNMDGYQNDNGLNLKNTDSISFLQFMQQNASAYGMQIGLKNSLDILQTVSPIVQFAVNEECGKNNECTAYNNFLESGKPVFHIEYPAKINSIAAGERAWACTAAGTTGMSSVMKNLSLDGLVYYCDGSNANTPTKGGNPSTGPSGRPPPRTTRSSRQPFTPPPRTSTRRSSSTPPPVRTSSSRPAPPPPPVTPTFTSARPTSTPSNPGGGNGCTAKHWDQCGGQNWNGCTVCAAGFQCKGVSPPYYYQCL